MREPPWPILEGMPYDLCYPFCSFCAYHRGPLEAGGSPTLSSWECPHTLAPGMRHEVRDGRPLPRTNKGERNAKSARPWARLCRSLDA